MKDGTPPCAVFAGIALPRIPSASMPDADIAIADTARNVKGDSVTVIAVDTKPVTIFLAATPIGDPGSAATISHVIGALQVTKS